MFYYETPETVSLEGLFGLCCDVLALFFVLKKAYEKVVC